MQRSRIIALASVVLLIGAFLFGVMKFGNKEASEGEGADTEVSATMAEGGVDALPEGQGAAPPAPSSGKKILGDSKTPPTTPSDKVAAVKTEAPCQIVDLKSDVSETKGHLHEFRLERTLGASEPLCVTVDGKSVSHTRMKDGRVRIDWKIAKPSSKVSAQFCTEGVKCTMSCPEPEKDFWESIGGDDAAAVGTGFAEGDTAEDRELQKEIKALKDVLNRKPTEAPVAKWSVVARHDSSCK